MLSHSYDLLSYHEGFGNHFGSEALKGALPKGQNSPQKCEYGLYAEQLSGTAFTAPRASNQFSWLYRVQPSVTHLPFDDVSEKFPFITNDFMDKNKIKVTPNQLRWKPLPLPAEETPKNFIEGMVTHSGSGHPSMKSGIAIYLYAANKSMVNEAFYNSDGDLLIVPQEGILYIITEFGKMIVKPREICVIPRGIRFAVEVKEPVRGYIAEPFKGHFKIPDLGPIGANGLAGPRDFQTPVAFYEKIEADFKIYNKYQGEMFVCKQDHSPFDVVAWHGNFVPSKYNFDLFNAMNTVTFDHPDPSIFTVLTVQSDEAGTAVLDFAIFPPRWMVAEHTFRPPYFHRNIMSEFMGNICGTYDAKENGFGPGCSSLHSVMTPHGPETDVFKKASQAELKPMKYAYESLAFMFESCYMLRTTKFMMDEQVKLDHDYYLCWQNLKPNLSNI